MRPLKFLHPRLRQALAWRRKRNFTYIYDTNYWSDPESRSGPGSRRDSGSVRHVLDVLATVTERYAIRTIADIPCGDFNWIGAYLEAWPEVDYVGFDIVDELIKRNRENHPGRRFALLDIVTAIPPRSDLILCKDLINHLETGEIIEAIANMRRSGSKYLLATNNFGYPNSKLFRSRFNASRHVDITTAPFHYPAPLWHDHYLGLWQLADLERPSGRAAL